MDMKDAHSGAIAINHYEILGLNPKGKGESDVPYLEGVIRQAFLDQSRKWHPDKNPDPGAPEKFNQIKKSSEVLLDPEKRAEFDNDLERNPHLAAPRKALMLDLDEGVLDTSSSSRAAPSARPGSQAIIVRPAVKGVNLTQLLKSAEASSDIILSMANEKPDFAKAVLGNLEILNRLSLQQQFELLFIIMKHQIADSSFILEGEEKEHYQYILESLKTTSKHHSDYARALTLAAVNKPDLAKDFFDHNAELMANLVYEDLLIMSQKLYYIVPGLLARFSNLIRMIELDFLLNTHSDKQSEIIELFRRNASPAKIRELDLMLRLKGLIESNSILNAEDPSHCEIINVLGFEAYELADRYINSYMDENGELSEEKDIYSIKFNIQFLNIYFAGKDEAFIDRLDIQIKSKLAIILYSTVSILSIYFKNKPDLASEFSSILKNGKIIKIILNGYNYNLLTIFSKIAGKKVPDDVKKEYATVLIDIVTDSGELFLKKLLVENFSDAYEILRNNRYLLRSIFQNPVYRELIEENEMVSKNLAMLAAKAGLSEDEVKLESLPGRFRIQYEGFKYFYPRYIDELPHKITKDEFEKGFSKAGFFPDLFRLDISDTGTFEDGIEIRYLILKAASIYEDFKGLDDEQDKFTFWLKLVLANGTDLQFNELLTLYQKKYPEAFDYVLSSRGTNTSSYNGLTLISRLEDHSDSQERFITGQLLNQWDLDFTKEAMIKELSVNFYGIIRIKIKKIYDNPEIEKLEIKLNDADIFEKNKILKEILDLKLKSIASRFMDLNEEFEKEKDPEKKVKLFESVLEFYKAHLQKLFPNCAINGYIALKESRIYRDKINAYHQLIEFMDEIEKAENPNTDGNLVKLLGLIEKSGLDVKTFEIFKIRLKDRPIFHALATIVFDSSERFKLSKKLIKLIKPCVLSTSNLEKLSLNFFELAKIYIKKSHIHISGDYLSALYQAHGDALLPVIEQYGLVTKLNNGRRLARVAELIRKSGAKYKNAAVDPEQLIADIIRRFHVLVEKSLFEVDNAEFNQQSVAELQAELISLVANEEISNPTINALIDSYHMPEEQKEWCDTVKIWLFELAIAGDDYASDKVKALLNNLDDRDSNLILLANYLHSIRESATLFTELEALLDDVAIDQVIECYLKKIDPDQDNLKSNGVYIRKLLMANKLSLSHLGKLNKIQLNRIYELGSELLDDQFEKVLKIDQAPLNLKDETGSLEIWLFEQALNEDAFSVAIVNRFLNDANKGHETFQRLVDYLKAAKNPNCNYKQLEKVFGVDFIRKIVQAYIDPILNPPESALPKSEVPPEKINAIVKLLSLHRLSFSELAQLGIEHVDAFEKFSSYFLSSAFKGPIANFKDLFSEFSGLMMPYNEMGFLFILFEQGIFSREELAEFRSLKIKDFIASKAYEKICLKFDFQKENIQTFIKKAQFIKEFLSNGYLKYLNENILKPIDEELDRLLKENAFLKQRALVDYKVEILNLIADKIFLMDEKTNPGSVIRDIHFNLIIKMRSIIKSPAINQKRNHIKSFFKGVLGVLLAIPMLFIPVAASKTYRQSFFGTQSGQNLEKLSQSLSKYRKTELADNPRPRTTKLH